VSRQPSRFAAAQPRRGSSDASAAISDRLRQVGVVPVVELPEAQLAIPLAEALVAGGLSCVEITFRTPAAQAGLEALRKAYPDMLLGAGTVFDEEQLTVAVSAGADFVVSPGTNPELVKACLARGLPILPGVCTPSEIEVARALGLNAVKFFPAEPMGGVSFLRALCGPYRDVSFVPTGGITASVLGDYLAVPQVLACGGSWMVKPELLRAGEFDTVRSLAEEATAIVGRSR
jgi:2-dehydro-3-deoxyphosphogluconate aldolase/(4S)-4-hydroxy-2-oxoglutarate aldolase